MDAKELARRARVRCDDNWFTKEYEKALADQIELYANRVAEKKCKEQKEICAKQVHNGTTIRNSQIDFAIRNAPLATDQ